MSRARRFFAVLLPSLLLTFLPARAAERTHVQASLVAADASVQPGHEVLVALRLVHEPHWHTYWVSPGTGLPTSLTWTLPPGWKAGEIQWPTPAILRDHTETIVGQGYDGETLLPVILTAPAGLTPGSKVTLTASAEWLMCADVCVPGNSDLTLTIPVTAETPQPNPTWGTKIRAVVASLPRPDSDWKVSAQRADKTVTLTVTPAVAPSHAPKTPWFFASDGAIAYDQPQTVKEDGHGGFVLTLAIAPEAPADFSRLTGVLAATNGWRADGTLPGLAIDLPLSKTTTAATSGAPSHSSSPAASPTNGGATPPPGAATSLGGTLLLAFIGGLILNLMPCVFPVLGIKILGFVNQAGHDRRRVALHGMTFALGVLLSFWTLASVLAILRAGGDQLGWGFQLQSAGFVYALAILLLVFGMNMSGVFEFGLRATAVGSDLQSKSGYAGSFFSGVLATVVATPCSAPFLAPALGAALAVSTAESFLIFTAIAVGLALPYLLLSIFPQAVKVLPRPGAWMETFKQIMAFPLYATVAYLIWVLAAQTGEEGFRNVLFSFVLVALAVWMYGRWTAPGTKPGKVRFAYLSLILVGAFGLWVGWPRTPAPISANASAPDVVWAPWSAEAVAKLRNEGRPIYVDFTARWCATCQANKRLVFHDEAVLKHFAEKKIATLRGDWTNQDPKITAELARYNRSAVPFNLVWLPGKDQPVILPELLTPSIVLNAVQ